MNRGTYTFVFFPDNRPVLPTHLIFIVTFQVPDLNKLYRQFYPGLDNTSLMSLKLTDFLCPYETEHVDGCACSPCCSMSYRGCQCFKSHFNNRNIMSCKSSNLTRVPDYFPNFVTELALISNSTGTLDKGTFAKSSISQLIRLSLGDNRIHLISYRNRVYYDEALDMSGLKPWYAEATAPMLNIIKFDNMSSLKILTIHNNHWQCDCRFGPIFQNFVHQNNQIIHIPVSVTCSFNPVGSFTNADDKMENITEESILQIDSDFCRNTTVQIVVEHSHHISVVGLISLTVVFSFIYSFHHTHSVQEQVAPERMGL